MENARHPCHGFEAAAHEAFVRLCAGSDFRCVESYPNRVRYESPSVYFEVGYSVSHDREVYARIGRVGSSGERLDLGLLLAVADPAGYAELRRIVPCTIVASAEHLGWVLRYFAAGLESHGQPLLVGESCAYGRAGGVRFWHAPDFPPEALATPPGLTPRWWA